MKVVMLTPSVSRSAGGIFEIERCLSQSLQTLDGVNVEVFSLEDGHAAEDVTSWWPLHPCLFSITGPRAFGYAPDLFGNLGRLKADVLHLHALWMYTSLAALRWSKKTRKPHIVTINGMLDPWAVRHARWKKQIAGWLYEKANLRSAACLQVNSEKEWQAVRDYGLTNPVCLIPNGVTLPQSDTLTTQAPWSQETEPDHKVLLYLGRIHLKKGISPLLAAWDKVRYVSSDASTWQLMIIGWDDGGHEAHLQQQVAEAGLEDSVYFLGPRFGEEKEAAFQHADAFILPSFSEGLPMAVLEAWAHRLPVVMTPACNLSEGFQSGAALSVQPEADSIAEGLATLFEMNDSERIAMGIKGRALVEEKFTWPNVASQMRDVYAWVLGGGTPPDCVRFD